MAIYIGNDPNHPIIINDPNIDNLPDPCPQFTVQYRKAGNHPTGSVQAQAGSVYTTIAIALRFVQGISKNKLTKWPRTNNLMCVPRAGNMLNAYYDGGSLKFFYFKAGNKIMYTCESSDIVTHELGHAVLDAWRPDLWHTQSMEVFGFHESFGDMMAILCLLSRDEVLEALIKDTNINIRQPNFVTGVAEEMGLLFGSNFGLRNAVNNFNYSEPETLPKNAPTDQLSSECHSFSRVFTGAFWEFFCNQFDKNNVNGNPIEALRVTRDQVANVLFTAILSAAVTPRFYESVARAMLLVDSNCKDSVQKAFSSRNILKLSADIPMMSVEISSGKEHKFDEGELVVFGETNRIVLNEGVTTQMSQVVETNPLYNVAVKVPGEQYIEKKDGEIVFFRPVDNLIEVTKSCLDSIFEEGKVSFQKDLPEPTTEFSVVDGKLFRNYFKCGCHR